MTNLGVIFPPDLPPERLRPVVEAAERGGLEELWLWEDCFAESGIATAAAALARTSRLHVGIGLLPVPLRNVALTAMELATLARLYPGRLVPGIGHGVAAWMTQVGAGVESPMTLLREYTTALRALLRGEQVSVAGRYVRLDRVRLNWPPSEPPPLLVGGIGPKTVQLAGTAADGVILVGETTPDQLAEAAARVQSGAGAARAQVVVFVPVIDQPAPQRLAALITDRIARGATTVALHSIGDAAPPLVDFVDWLATEVRPLL